MYESDVHVRDDRGIGSDTSQVTVMDSDWPCARSDQVSIAFDVHEHPTVIHRFVTEIDEPEDYDRPPQKPPRQEF